VLSVRAGRLARMLTWTVVDSPVDELLLTSAEGGLRSIWFSPHKAKRTSTFVEEMARAGGVRDDDEPVLVRTATQLEEYFRGERRDFDLPLQPSGSEFQMQVWGALRTIPYGVTWSYGELAASIGKGPVASRAVGLANGANPISIVIPCHRVIGADGSLTGYGGGLDRKRYLLELERPSLFSA
jgi:methylated-DNA-[protein]-cysteine S-methyltransferase